MAGRIQEKNATEAMIAKTASKLRAETIGETGEKSVMAAITATTVWR